MRGVGIVTAAVGFMFGVLVGAFIVGAIVAYNTGLWS